MKTQLQVVPITKAEKKPSAASWTTIGIDLGDQWSHYCVLNDDGEIVEEGRFRTTPEALAKHFQGLSPARIAMEAGTHSIWISEQLRQFGHEVIVANVRELHAICRNDRKSDRVDAEKLARYARLDPEVLRPIAHRSVAMQEALTLIRARAALVQARVAMVNAVRGLAKPCGYRLPAVSTKSLAKRCLAELPAGLLPALGPLVEQIDQMSQQIRQYDRLIHGVMRSRQQCGAAGRTDREELRPLVRHRRNSTSPSTHAQRHRQGRVDSRRGLQPESDPAPS